MTEHFPIKGPWSHSQARQFIQQSTWPLRLACVGGDGYPRVVSLWHRFDGSNFHCVTHRASKLTGLLRNNHKVGFELAPNEPPYHGVRGQGLVSLHEEGGADTLREHLEHYLGGTESDLARWLLSRAEDELLVCIEVIRMFSWDYRERMAGGG
jgi:hypothetical protein